MKVLAFSLVTNNAVLQSVPRGDDAALSSLSPSELEDYLSKGKANHEEVLEAGREAALDMQASLLSVLRARAALTTRRLLCIELYRRFEGIMVVMASDTFNASSSWPEELCNVLSSRLSL